MNLKLVAASLSWLLVAFAHATADEATTRQQLGSLRAAIEDLAASFPNRYRAEDFRARWEELSKLADALNEYTDRPIDVRAWVDELMGIEGS